MKLHLSIHEGALQIARTSRLNFARLAQRGRHVFTFAFVLGALFASSAQLQAREKKDLEIRLIAQRVTTDASGAECLTDIVDAAPGDVVQYTAIFLNAGDKPLRHLTPTLPIPAGMEYLAASAAPAAIAASIDGESFGPLPLIMERKLERGIEIFVEFSPRIYRALRWKVAELAPGQSITVTARAVVLATP